MSISFPLDPLDRVSGQSDKELRRRTIQGILESYHGNYDVLAEALQNSIDAVEDAKIEDLPGPYSVMVRVNLDENWISVTDTGVGMTPEQVASAFVPHLSFKSAALIVGKRNRKNMYRGYKGVGLTFLAYGTDDIRLHSVRDGVRTKSRMDYGRKWAMGERDSSAMLVMDSDPSPIDKLERGTYIRIQFSGDTKPRSLKSLASSFQMWEAVLRTRTAVGQVLLQRNPLAKIEVGLELVENQRATLSGVTPNFLYPHEVVRRPPFRFLDLVEFHRLNPETSSPPADKLRQDGIFLEWDSSRIVKELTEEQREELGDNVAKYNATLYGFIPYQASVWADLNEIVTGVRNRTHLHPGLVIAVNRQRLADRLDIETSRFEQFSRNVLVLVHFDGAKPDHGRKTLEQALVSLAQKAADRVVQYLAKQRAFLRPTGESPTPDQREVERGHSDWLLNVQLHARTSPLDLKPVTFLSLPLTEQDVVGLFHQFSALGLFAGIRIFATSQIQTYDCLVEFDCPSDTTGLRYGDSNPLGVSPFVAGDKGRFRTRVQTLEFKLHLDALIADLDGESNKSFANIDICVCWSKSGEALRGYEIEEISENNLDERPFPGVTHLLHRDSDAHVIKVVVLSHLVGLIQSGRVDLLSMDSSRLGLSRPRTEVRQRSKARS